MYHAFFDVLLPDDAAKGGSDKEEERIEHILFPRLEHLIIYESDSETERKVHRFSQLRSFEGDGGVLKGDGSDPVLPCKVSLFNRLWGEQNVSRATFAVVDKLLQVDWESTVRHPLVYNHCFS